MTNVLRERMIIMFKKFQDWFFKEDVDELDLDENLLDEEEEAPSVYEEPIQRKAPVEKPIEKVYEPERKVVVPIEKPIERAKMSFDIKADGQIQKEEPKKANIRASRRDEYEMPQVISPYFGVKEETSAQGHNVALNKIPSDKKHDRFNDVISPIYGINDHEIHAETQSVLEDDEMTFFQNKEKEVEPLGIYVPSLEAEESSYEMLEDENMALDEIIADTNNDEDDLIQFSLFGENKKIQEEESFENEEIDNGEDALPF